MQTVDQGNTGEILRWIKCYRNSEDEGKRHFCLPGGKVSQKLYMLDCQGYANIFFNIKVIQTIKVMLAKFLRSRKCLANLKVMLATLG